MRLSEATEPYTIFPSLFPYLPYEWNPEPLLPDLHLWLMEQGKLADSSWTKRVNSILSLPILYGLASSLLSLSDSFLISFPYWLNHCKQRSRLLFLLFSRAIFLSSFCSGSGFTISFLSSSLFQEALRPLLVVYGLISLFDFLSCNDLPTKRGQADRTYSNNRPSPTYLIKLISKWTNSLPFIWLTVNLRLFPFPWRFFSQF